MQGEYSTVIAAILRGWLETVLRILKGGSHTVNIYDVGLTTGKITTKVNILLKVAVYLSANGIFGALGGDFSVGCHVDTIVGSAAQWVRFSQFDEVRIHQLVLTVL